MNASFIKTKRLAEVNRREVVRKEILFTTNLIIAKSVNKLLLETSAVNLETSAVNHLCRLHKTFFEPDSLSEPGCRTLNKYFANKGAVLPACINITLFAKFLKENKI